MSDKNILEIKLKHFSKSNDNCKKYIEKIIHATNKKNDTFYIHLINDGDDFNKIHNLTI